MLMADTMAIFFIIFGLMLALPGLWLLCRGLWPETVSAAADTCQRGLWQPFLTGLPVTLLVILGAAAASNLFGTPGKMAALALACVYLIHAHAGVAGLATCVGGRLVSRSDASSPWQATLRGGVALELSFLLPLAGWFVILPASIVVGSGAATLCLLKRRFASSPIRPTSFLSETATAGAEAAGLRAGDQAGAAR